MAPPPAPLICRPIRRSKSVRPVRRVRSVRLAHLAVLETHLASRILPPCFFLIDIDIDIEIEIDMDMYIDINIDIDIDIGYNKDYTIT